ncbi:MAG: HAMP domain-containing histidine kinase [bacterium]|nr:HAMP domain-containing histidine kinase [bacterium]
MMSSRKRQKDLERQVCELQIRQTELETQNAGLRRAKTELEQLNQVQPRTDRLASLGTLTAGLAHELNNPLGIIQLLAEDALLNRDEGAREEALATISQQVRHCAEIARGVLRYSRREDPQMIEVEFDEIARRSIKLTHCYAAQSGVDLSYENDTESALVLGNATELEQVIINLLCNAVDASASGACVLVTLIRFGDLLRLSVSDEGSGMTDETLTRAFEPFYSTKGETAGTGLGLSVGRGIVWQHGGGIWIESEAGKGTTVTVELAAYAVPPIANSC